MHRTNLILVVAAAAFMAVGCTSSSEPPMPAQDAANFNGKKAGGPMSAEKKKAMSDFQENFKKMHPPTGGPSQPGPAGPG